jgi:hypothetical protein
MEADPLVYPTEVEAVGKPLLSAEREEESGRRRWAWVLPVRWLRGRWAWVSSVRWLRRSQPVG